LRRKHVTVILVPDGSSKVHSFRLPVKLLKSLAAVLPLALFAAFFLLGDSLDPVFDKNSFPALKAENLALRKKLDKISLAVDELRHVVLRNFDLERQARLLADLEPTNEDVKRMGVGGPETFEESPIAAFDPALARSVGATQRELDQLIRQAQLQTESFSEVMTTLEGRRELLKRTPSISPVPGGFKSSGFGNRVDPFTGANSFHEGVDLCAPRGTPVFAPADGVVRFAANRAGYGLTIAVDHGNGVTTWFAHVGSIKVSNGQSVKRGQTIATVGTSGRATAPHVHYEVRQGGKAVDPVPYILPSNVVVD
jgi:murein DD-endopeptidase MepM/ murein hydrolase activator NlpD